MTRIKLGILTPDDYSPYKGIPESVIASEKHAELSREAARKGIVLLKNDNQLLPLSKSIREIYLTGPFALDAYSLIGNYYGFSGKMSTFMEGIVAKVSNGTSVNFKIGSLATAANVNPNELAVEQSRKAPVCIVFLGLNGSIEGEEGDAIASPTLGDRASLSLPEPQMALIRKIGKDRKNKVITVLTGGSPIDLKEISELSDAIFMTWYPGQEGGNALGDLIFGDASPSGRLPVTFPVSVDALPAFDDYSMQGRTYKYMKDNIAYPFGYGLTYSTVKYSNMVVEQPDRKKTSFSVKVTLENQGKYAIEDVPQLYVKAPGAGVTTPLNSLIGFRRVPLSPGERKEVTFDVSMDQLQMVMEDGKKQLLKGSYTLTVSGAAPSDRTTALNVPQSSWTGTL
jgi:beta-glucosidase